MFPSIYGNTFPAQKNVKKLCEWRDKCSSIHMEISPLLKGYFPEGSFVWLTFCYSVWKSPVFVLVLFSWLHDAFFSQRDVRSDCACMSVISSAFYVRKKLGMFLLPHKNISSSRIFCRHMAELNQYCRRLTTRPWTATWPAPSPKIGRSHVTGATWRPTPSTDPTGSATKTWRPSCSRHSSPTP